MKRTRTGRPILTGRPDKTHDSVMVPQSEIPEGYARCPSCRAVAYVNASQTLRKHLDLFGHQCFNKAMASYEMPPVPPVLINNPQIRRVAGPRTSTAAAESAPQVVDLDLDLRGYRPNGACFKCSKPIPPMRRLCGRSLHGPPSRLTRRGAGGLRDTKQTPLRDQLRGGDEANN